MRTLVWFRNDLRLADNPALHAARRAGSRGVLAVFVACPGQWRRHDVADIRVDLIRRTLGVLSADLAERRIALRILSTDTDRGVPDALIALAREHGCDELHFNAEYEVNERRRDEAVREQFETDGRGCTVHHDQCIIPPGRVRTGSGTFYSVFTPFKRNVLAQLRDDGVPEAIAEPPPADEMIGTPDNVPASLGFDEPPKAMRELWPGGEAEATRRLQRFIEGRTRDYAESRNLPDEDATSRLSPYLAVGCVSARTCLRAAKEANHGHLSSGSKGLDTWISELVWRDFYRHVMVGWPRVGMGRAFKPETDDIAWNDDEDAFAAWCTGRTGYPIVDAGMRQLLAEGWMHNRLRMVTAMFLTKDLLIDWRWGERHFMRHLVDGDQSSNNGGWQWSASTGTDAQPWFRIFNPTTQGQRFDPDGDFVRRMVPELESIEGRAVHEPSRRAGLFEEIDYPSPIVDHAAAREHTLAVFKSLK